MSTEADGNRLAERSPSPQRPDAEHVELGEEEIDDMKMDLSALEKLVTEGQREAAAIRQRLGHAKDSGNDHASRGKDLPALKPGSALAKAMAKIDRALIERGLSYLDNALTIEHLLNRKSGHGFVVSASAGGLQPRNGRLQDYRRGSVRETAPDYNEQRESVSAAIDALALSQETEEPVDNNSHRGER